MKIIQIILVSLLCCFYCKINANIVYTRYEKKLLTKDKHNLNDVAVREIFHTRLRPPTYADSAELDNFFKIDEVIKMRCSKPNRPKWFCNRRLPITTTQKAILIIDESASKTVTNTPKRPLSTTYTSAWTDAPTTSGYSWLWNNRVTTESSYEQIDVTEKILSSEVTDNYDDDNNKVDRSKEVKMHDENNENKNGEEKKEEKNEENGEYDDRDDDQYDDYE